MLPTFINIQVSFHDLLILSDFVSPLDVLRIRRTKFYKLSYCFQDTGFVSMSQSSVSIADLNSWDFLSSPIAYFVLSQPFSVVIFVLVYNSYFL